MASHTIAKLKILAARAEQGPALEDFARRLTWARTFSLGAAIAVLSSGWVRADQIPVKQIQGSMYGFLVLKNEAGKVIAEGDQINVVHGDRVKSRLVFHFHDGSIDDETTVFVQRKTFQLISDDHVQKGPSFPKPMEIAFDVANGEVRWREFKDGKQELKTQHMKLPADLANGMISLIVENFSDQAEMKVSYLVAIGSKPRIVTFAVKPDGQDEFRLGGTNRRAERFNFHIEIGGMAGLLAPVVGKQPPDFKLWVARSKAPSFLRMRGPLYEGGPIWTMELAAPVWPQDKPAR